MSIPFGGFMQSQSVNTVNTTRAFIPGPWQSQQAIAAAAAREAAQQYARENLRLNFADAEHWRELAAAAGVRLPAWYVRSTGGRIRKFCTRLNLSQSVIDDATGCSSYKQLAALNPTWPLFAVVGILLELSAEHTTATIH
ncbi:hypothetical protein [Pseudomonas syringae]|uniref:Uncharacterized protein n=1 Tax=Pseudomonas syringae pv. actinidiae TaxID=103796 RepID=A0A2V0QFC8_PSESF|nr:hypothetical protein [Pseudomonas syringae]AQL38747.1 hypothetical protein JN853_21545 [Pseudomonas syringae pv. actinidiae ICMP 9853]EGH68723.1 hypothetical protein PSYAC_28343 [Pseudomonas syringae pv. actinidiae str. M302091]EPM50788.1 hypothetical protein A256_17536 [Pseudomonas syringae pv. actinidiae ICMP 19103]EPM86126.1 hypothetical protein A260_17838 [Pseudomonas syringae pv. actinidiae ICMP 19068]EPM95205.1 hypothetical protein A258_17830 [Pseudomonas syringae pv. actinidiae ICMP 